MSADDFSQAIPVFDRLAEAFSLVGVRHSPAEAHGVICGLLACGYGGVDEEMLAVLARYVELEGQWPGTLADMLLDCRNETLKGMASEELGLELVMPDDEEDFGLRVAAAGQWCEGFLVGFGTATAGRKDSDFSPALQEAVSDLAAISRVDVPDQAGEEELQMLEQVLEHCRMSALMIYSELVMKEQAAHVDQSAGEPPAQH